MDSKAVGYLEISANVMTTVAILLAGRNSIHTWWTGIVGCLLFCFLFYQSLLYADVVLQMFFIVTSMVGWWGWRRGHQGQSLPISHIDLRKSLWLVPFGLLATGAYGLLLHYFTDAYAPFYRFSGSRIFYHCAGVADAATRGKLGILVDRE